MIYELVSQSILLNLLGFTLTLLAGAIVTRTVLMPFSASLVRKRGGDEKAAGASENMAVLTGMLASLVAALQVRGFGNLVTVLGTVAAAATVAIGFGMRDQISNLVAGVFIHLDTPFVRGDYITTEELEGTVKKVGLRSTVIDSGREKHMVPNAQITTKVSVNHTKNRKTYSGFEDSFLPHDAGKAAENIRESLAEVEGGQRTRCKIYRG